MATLITPEQYAKAGTEHAHQVAVFMWIQQEGKTKFPELARLFAIPNGGERHDAVAARLKAEGVRSGVPDLFLPVPRGGYCGLFIEMKKPESGKKRKGKTSDAQDEWLAFLQVFYQTAVCWTWTEARDELLNYCRLYHHSVATSR